MSPTQEQIEALRFWSESALTRKLYRGNTPLSDTLADVVETLSQARAAPAPGYREGYAAALEAVSDMKFLIPLIEQQSCGEWDDSMIASDARRFRDAIRAITIPETPHER